MVWSQNGTLSLIEHIKGIKVLKLLDGKAVRNAHVYESLSKQIQRHCYLTFFAAGFEDKNVFKNKCPRLYKIVNFFY